MKEVYIFMDVNNRLHRLETQNRRLAFLCVLSLGLPLISLGAWTQRPPDVVRARRIEVVDERGVPLVILEPSRQDEGGSVVLRDRNGERRSWWQAGPGTAALGLLGGPVDRPQAVSGLNAGEEGAQVSLVGPNGASVAASVDAGAPKVELRDSGGKSLFVAPVRRG